MHNKVSNTAEASCGGDCDWVCLELSGFLSFFASLEEAEDERSVVDCWRGEGDELTCLETSRRSTRICDVNRSALSTIEDLANEPRESISVQETPW